jgi:AhpD family alkylhydroperoxidase
MSQRFELFKYLKSDAIQGLLRMKTPIEGGQVDHTVLGLVVVRVSQINGCAYCIDMHTKDARAEGETEQRLYGLDAWRETPYYTDRERAALAWAEALTNIKDGHAPDDVYEQMRAQFSEPELMTVTLAAVATNSWNRLVISSRRLAGTYQPPKKAKAEAQPQPQPANA